jgi:AAA domain
MRHGVFVQGLSNVTRFNAAVKRARQRGLDVLVEGGPGLGKTATARALESDSGHSVCYYRLNAQDSPRIALHGIENVLAGEHRCRDPRAWDERSSLHLFLDIRRVLEEARRPTTLIVDECDYLVEHKAMERLLHTLRDIRDQPAMRLTLVLVSISSLAAKLAAPSTGLLAAVSSRLSERLVFAAPSLDDAMLLARELLEDVSLARDLVGDAIKRTDGSVRSLMTEFEEIESVAHAAKLPRLDLATYRNLTVPPAPVARSNAKTGPFIAERKVAAA